MSGGGILYGAVQKTTEDEAPIEYVRDQQNKDTCRKFLRLMRNNAASSPPGERRSFQTGNILVNTLIAEDRTILVAACKDDFNRAAVFECLAEMKKGYSQSRTNPTGIERMLKQNVDKYSSGTDKISEIKNTLETVKSVMVNNIDAIIERGQKIDDLVSSSETLLEQAEVFESSASDLKWSMWKKRIIIFIVIFIILIVVIFIIVLLVCRKDGMNFDKCK